MNKKSTIIILAILLTSVFLAYVYFFFNLKKINADIANISSLIDSEDDKEASLRLSSKSLAETEKEREVLRALFLRSDGAVAFIETLEEVAQKSGAEVNIESLSIETLPSDGLEKLNVRLEAAGSWGSVYKFLILTENLPLALDLSRASFSKQEKSSQWALQITIGVLKLQ